MKEQTLGEFSHQSISTQSTVVRKVFWGTNQFSAGFSFKTGSTNQFLLKAQ
jgi:hypothetical protein